MNIIKETETVKIDIRKDGRVVIKTNSPYLPTEACQQILDHVVKDVMSALVPDELREQIHVARSSMKAWKVLAIGQLIIIIGYTILEILKFKGVL